MESRGGEGLRVGEGRGELVFDVLEGKRGKEGLTFSSEMGKRFSMDKKMA